MILHSCAKLPEAKCWILHDVKGKPATRLLKGNFCTSSVVTWLPYNLSKLFIKSYYYRSSRTKKESYYGWFTTLYNTSRMFTMDDYR